MPRLCHCMLGFTEDTDHNIGRLTALIGETVAAASAVYMRGDGDAFTTVSGWHAPGSSQTVSPSEDFCRSLLETRRGESMFSEREAGIQITVRDAVAGCLWLSFTEKPAFSPEDLAFLHAVASAIGSEELRRSAAAELSRQAQRSRSVLDQLDIGIVVLAPNEQHDDFIIQEANRTVTEIETLSRAELIGSSLKARFPHTAGQSGLYGAVMRVAESRMAAEHPIVRYKNGELTLWRDNRIFPLPDGELAVVSTVETGRKKSELRLQESEERFRLLAENSFDAIITINQLREIVFWNKGAGRMFGFEAQEILGRPFTTIIPPRYHKAAVQGIETFFSTGDSVFFGQIIESTCCRKDGSEFFVEMTVSAYSRSDELLLTTIIRDITERKQAEEQLRLKQEELRNSEETLKMLFEYAPDAYYLSDLKGTFIDGNQAAERLSGYRRAELIGRNFLKLKILPKAQIVKAAGLLAKNMLGMPTGPDEFILHQKNGNRITVEISTFPVTIKARRLVLGLARDITERKRLETALLEIEEYGKQQIGHDLHDGLGQHLAGLTFLSRALAQKLAASGHPAASDAQAIVDFANDAVSQTRDMARILAPLGREGSLATALKALAASIENIYGVTCTFKSNQPDIVQDRTEATHLYRIAQEAANNAVKHGRPDTVEIVLTAREGNASLSITDNGSGIPDNPTPGAGMGLGIMHYRATMIGATLEIGRADGGGTVVTCSCKPRE